MVKAHVTRKGCEVGEEALPGRDEVIASLWDGLDDDELSQLVALLEAVGRPSG